MDEASLIEVDKSNKINTKWTQCPPKPQVKPNAKQFKQDMLHLSNHKMFKQWQYKNV